MTKKSFFAGLLPAALTLLVLVGLLQLNFVMGWIADYLLPGPGQILSALFQEDAGFGTALQETLLNTLFGFGISFVVGTSLALLLSLNSTFERAFLPISVFFQTVPIIAIAPLLVIWFGFGGPTVRASAFVVSLFPILANTLAGLAATPATRLELFRSFRASRFQTLVQLKIPQALPQFFTGLEIAVGLAVIGAIVGEFIAGSGLGSLIDVARTQQRVDMVFAAVALTTFMGISLVGLVKFVRFLVFKYRPFDHLPED